MYRDYNYTLNKYQRNMNNITLFDENEGYMKGNMFKNLYDPYLNYKQERLQASTELEKMFLDMAIANFAAHDINLYLDLYPNDGNMIDIFNMYRERANNLTNRYEEKYGPVTINSNSLNTSPFLWQSEVFPWNMTGDWYV